MNTSKMTRHCSLALALGLIVAGSARAQGNGFLKLGGSGGEARAGERIEIDSYAWGASQLGGFQAKQPPPGARTLRIERKVDETSSLLAEAHAKGTQFPEATLAVPKGGGSQEYLVIKMKPVYITSYQTGGSQGAVRTETIRLNFSKIEFRTPQAPAVEQPPGAAEGLPSLAGEQSTPSPTTSGDYNNDGFVDAADFTVWQAQKTQPQGSAHRGGENFLMALPGMPAEKVVVRGWNPTPDGNGDLGNLEIEVVQGALQDALRRAHRSGEPLDLTLKAQDGTEYFQWELKRVRVTSYSVSGAADAAHRPAVFQIISSGRDR